MGPVVLLVFFVAQVYCNPSDREGRLFGYTYTSTVVQPQYITTLIPSSCVQVAPSIPPCRNVRVLYTPPQARFFFGNDVQEQEQKNAIIISDSKQNSTTTTQGWGEYLGLVAPTETVTTVNLLTTTAIDPNSVVTYSVTGCKPTKLPLGLKPCPQDNQISPTQTRQPIMTSTIQVEPTTAKLDVSEANSVTGTQTVPTTTLPAAPKNIAENSIQ